MADFRIVLVGTEYPMNLGYCARVLANFGYSEMHLVSPKAKVGKTAIMYAKHAHSLLENAKVHKTVKEAAEGCDFIVGTTGVLKRGKRSFRTPLSLEQFVEKVGSGEGAGRRYAILFGREGIGLTEAEVQACDLMVSIPADRKYPILNLSHALAIVLYAISGSRRHSLIRRAKNEQKRELLKTFEEMVDCQKGLRNPHKIKSAFKRVLGRSLISEVEAAALLCIFKKAKGEIKAKAP